MKDKMIRLFCLAVVILSLLIEFWPSSVFADEINLTLPINPTAFEVIDITATELPEVDFKYGHLYPNIISPWPELNVYINTIGNKNQGYRPKIPEIGDHGLFWNIPSNHYVDWHVMFNMSLDQAKTVSKRMERKKLLIELSNANGIPLPPDMLGPDDFMYQYNNGITASYLMFHSHIEHESPTKGAYPINQCLKKNLKGEFATDQEKITCYLEALQAYTNIMQPANLELMSICLTLNALSETLESEIEILEGSLGL